MRQALGVWCGAVLMAWSGSAAAEPVQVRNETEWNVDYELRDLTRSQVISVPTGCSYECELNLAPGAYSLAVSGRAVKPSQSAFTVEPGARLFIATPVEAKWRRGRRRGYAGAILLGSSPVLAFTGFALLWAGSAGNDCVGDCGGEALGYSGIGVLTLAGAAFVTGPVLMVEGFTTARHHARPRVRVANGTGSSGVGLSFQPFAARNGGGLSMCGRF